MKKIIVYLFVIFSNISFAGEKFTFYIPARPVMWGVKTFAIADFNFGEEKNTAATFLLIDKLKQHPFFKVIEPFKVEKLLQESNLTKSDLADLSKAKQICELLNIDAIVLGEITMYAVQPDENGIEDINKEVWTGDYERNELGKIVTENIDGQPVKKRKFETRMVKQPFKIRKGSVSITFKIIDGKTDYLATTSTLCEEYDSGRVPQENFKSLPSPGDILQSLSNEIIDKFTDSISPKHVSVTRDIEGDDVLFKEGKTYALGGFWGKAIEIWLEVEKQIPNDPSIYYDLGLAHEAVGEYDTAEIYYKKAILLNNKKSYEKALKNIREGREEKDKALTKGRH